jgi:thiamine-phosphate pyrophosphorylase
VTPRLIAITDRTVLSAEATLERFRHLGELARPGSVHFQLRDHDLSARERLRFARALSSVARDTEQLFTVNDRVDVAVLVGADGVHLGEASVDAADARRLLSATAFVSRASHDPETAAMVEADAVLLSPIVESRKGRPALGMAAISKARRAIERQGRGPLVFALGGISSEHVAACRSAGADGVAVVGAVLRGDGAAIVQALDIAR